MIYLDNAATTKMYEEVIEAEKYVELNYFANASALHSFGMDAENLINKTRKIIAKEINANDNEIFFTKGATESNNIVISSFASKDNEAITSSLEHSSVLDTFNNNEYKKVIFLKNDDKGYIDLEDLKSSLNENTRIVSIIYVQNEIGTIQEIQKISNIIKSYNKNIFFHIDATQALGKIECNVKKLGVDSLSFSAHKIHGPKGIGGIYINKKFLSKLDPILYGGRQERVSSGTYNTPAIYAMGKALELIKNKNSSNHVKQLNLYLRQLLTNQVEDILIVSPLQEVSYYILNVCFANIKSEVLLHMLEDEEIYVSSGSACSRGIDNRILENLKVSSRFLDGSIRFSFSEDINKEDLDKTVKVLKNSIDIIRKVI